MLSKENIVKGVGAFVAGYLVIFSGFVVMCFFHNDINILTLLIAAEISLLLTVSTVCAVALKMCLVDGTTEEVQQQ